MAPLRKIEPLVDSIEHGRLMVRDASAAPNSGPTMGLEIGIAVGGVLLIGILFFGIRTIRVHIRHRRLREAMDVEQAVRLARAQEIGEVPRPTSMARCSTFAPLHTRAGWGALSSNEAVDEALSSDRPRKEKRSSVSLPKRIKQRGMPLKRLKRLTAIMEMSPRSRSASSPAMSRHIAMQEQAADGAEGHPSQASKAYMLRMVDEGDVFVCPGSPKPDVLPSFAIRSPGRYGAGIANNDNPKASRSRSVGALSVSAADRVALQRGPVPPRPAMHNRSISLGAPPTQPPSYPVPPLPIIEPQNANQPSSARQGLCVSRLSSSSRGSTGSSVLVTSPILTMHDQDRPLHSPRVGDVVADDENASLKKVATNRRPQPQAMQSSGLANARARAQSEASIRSNIASYSVEDQEDGDHLSMVSLDSLRDRVDRLSIPRLGTAEPVSISRVSSSNSLGGGAGVQKVITPRKPKRASVSANGSPAERRKTSILRDISGNSLMPSRQPSNATQDSGRSSNGNPFQWDQPLSKPSALKGSPNARKGHKRQNCVRISTLTPQILGPPPSRPTSPNIMHSIEEESGDDQEAGDSNELRFVSNHKLSRPPSAASFAPNLRVQTLRASLTPSSPTLSAWNAYLEFGLPSMPSDSQLSVSASPATRSASGHSNRSSAFTIPSFPSPSKTTVAEVQVQQPVPQFCLSRPSTNTARDDDSSSPFALHLSSDEAIPSSPPVLMPCTSDRPTKEYDPAHPAWSSITIPKPVEEYDPASPVLWDITEPERSSPMFPFAATSLGGVPANEEASPRSVPNGYGGDMPDTPPCSPRTMPEGFQAFFENKSSASRATSTSVDELTSENASSIMSRLPPKHRPVVDFPGAPVLAPPEEPEGYVQTTPHRSSPLLPLRSSARNRAMSNAPPPPTYHPLRSAPPPPMPTIISSDVDPGHSSPHTVDIDMSLDSVSQDLDNEQHSDMPAALHLPSTNSKPTGPRNLPPQSVLKNAQALRRMNSEANAPTYSLSTNTLTASQSISGEAFFVDSNRESRRYVRMGREASPLLPWIGSPDLSEEGEVGMGGVFDFGFTTAGAEADAQWASALDDFIDLAEVERKLDGALAGFESPLASDDTVMGMSEKTDSKPTDAQKGSSVWEDGEKFWQLPQGKRERVPTVDVIPSSPLPVADNTPRKAEAWENELLGGRRSIQMTPKSLYDSDGFLRT